MLFYSDFESTGYNREHVWPKRHASFHDSRGGSNLHHLRPTNSTINSTRSNYTFGNVKEKVSGYITKENGGQTVLWYVSSSGYSSNGCDGLVEVRDNIKGDVARILLYVYVRWEEPNLFEKDPTPTVVNSDDKNDGLKVIEDLETLLEWCEIDPVDQWEMTRNDLTQNVQGNRNVFIDYPEFAWLLFGEDVPSGYNTPSDNGGSAVNPGTPGCTHQWSNATCTLPKTCSKCDATSGAALGHSWKNATCQQAKKCTVCGTVETKNEAHIYVDAKDTDCEKCGAVRVVGPIKDDALNVTLHAVEVRSDLRLGFYVTEDLLKDAVDYYMVFNKTEDFEGVTGLLTVEKDDFQYASGYYYAQYPVVRGCEMTVKIEATLYVVDADGTVRCSAITDSCSVTDYLAKNMPKWDEYVKTGYYATYYRNMLTVVVEMLNYGAEAQKKFNFNNEEGKLATDILTDELKAYALAETPVPVDNRYWGANNDNMPIVFKGGNLDLQTRIYNQIFIDVGAQDVADLKMVVKDSAGNVIQTVTEFIHYTGTWYKAPITEILPSEGRTIYTVQVFAGETAVSDLAQYSVESYLYVINNSAEMEDYRALGNAIMRYCVAADMAF